MPQSEINHKMVRFSERARLERLQSPEMVQKMKAVRHAGRKFARIVQTLRRADESVSPPVTAIDWYEIELLNAAIEEWSPDHGVYYEDDIRKYTVAGDTKIYKCILEHVSHPSKSPTNTSFWEVTTSIKAWVFGYSGDLLETVPWFQAGDIVEIINYDDSRWQDREWWILETVIRVEETVGSGEGAELYCSITWNEDENRAMAVFG